ncbi:MAG: AAA family ATPase, partial [Eubacteriales bacterium]|nr:AAA family ATPase [Eubacteriales bacterium]
MEINRLRLNQYRSYAALDLRPGPGINAIVGDNAEGKTNSVEAVFLCAFGRSHRTSRDAELIMRGCAGGYVGAELTNNTGSHLIEIKLRDGERKKIFIDRQMASRSGELMGMLNVVMFAPEDLSIVKEGPAE